MAFVFAASAVVGAGLGVYKAVSGANQVSDAKKMAKNNIFTPEEMPYEVGLGTDLAARNYTNGMPGTANAVNNINRNAATSFYRGQQGASSGGDILDLATRIGSGTNQATNQLSQQEADYKSGALGGYEGALGNQANWRARLYQNNVLNPYLRTANLAASMYGAGQQNLYSGLDDIGSAAVGYAKGQQGKTDTATTATRPPVNDLTTGTAGVGQPNISQPIQLNDPNQYNYGAQWNAPLNVPKYNNPYFPYQTP